MTVDYKTKFGVPFDHTTFGAVWRQPPDPDAAYCGECVYCCKDDMGHHTAAKCNVFDTGPAQTMLTALACPLFSSSAVSYTAEP